MEGSYEKEIRKKIVHSLARILSVWLLVDAGVLTAPQAHRLIGTWYRYPKCCTEFFLKYYDNEDLTWLCMIDCDKLGSYVQCHRCWEKNNVDPRMAH